jgi:hypothetical protein
MALVLKDRVKETTTTTGTGTLTLAGAATGFQSFSVIGNANTTYYSIVDSSAGTWEVGIGTYTSSGTTLSRDTVLESSNSGSKVNFGAGSKDVFCTYPAEKAVTLDDAQFTATGTGANTMPVGTTAQRPASPQAGMYRLNTTTTEPEWYDTVQSAWVSFRTTPTRTYTANYLVVAGGGGAGGASYSGGGGAGGYKTSSVSLTPAVVYSVTVGAGGAAGGSGSRGTNGNDSSLSGTGITTVTSTGGGGGAAGDSATKDGASGGSGGGGASLGGSSTGIGGSGTSGQGFAGGNGGTDGATYRSGGGGGGSSAVGSNIVAGVGGAGGAGTASSITGSSVTYAGGGGGGGNTSNGAGGAGGGGAAGATGTAGTANTGGGGGGTTTSTSGAGGSGVVILSVPTANYTGIVTGSPTVTTSGSNTIIKFTSSGTYTA